MTPTMAQKLKSLTKQSLILPLIMALPACSYFQHKENSAATTQTEAAVASNDKTSENKTEKPAEKQTENQIKAVEPSAPAAPIAANAEEKKSDAHAAHAQPAKVEAAKPTHETHHQAESAGVPAEKALAWLKNGNNRYLTNKLRSDGQNAKTRESLTTGQHPHTIILSCSDSRVPPEILFDQKLGEIFVVRAAGEALDSSTIASIEYAVAHLGSNLLVVMGHDSCGAIKAAFETLGGADAGSPYLNNLVKDIHPRIQSFAGKKISEHGNDESWANVQGIAKDLIERSAIIREAVANKGFKIAKSVYHLSSGQVEWKE